MGCLIETASKKHRQRRRKTAVCFCQHFPHHCTGLKAAVQYRVGFSAKSLACMQRRLAVGNASLADVLDFVLPD